MPSSRGSSRPRGWTCISVSPALSDSFFTTSTTWEALFRIFVAAAAKSLQLCLTVWPHRKQPTRLHRPWDSPGKNTGVVCRFLLQCMKMKSESEVAQSYPTLCDPMDGSPPGSSVYGIFQAGVLEWVPLPSPLPLLCFIFVTYKIQGLGLGPSILRILNYY